MIVKDYDRFLQLIKEGLIMSHDINQTENVIIKELLKLEVKHKVNIKNNNTLELIIYDKINIHLLYSLMSLTNNLGYYPSRVYLKSNNMEYDYLFDYDKLKNDMNKNLIEMKLVLESTFDIPIKIVPEFLYHITRNCYLDKIFKNGLVSKSKEKITYHPERIYYTYNLEDCYNLTERFKSNDIINPNKLIDFRNKKGYNIDYYNFTILKIKTEGLNIKLYQDPNFSDKGCYGYDNIPPTHIETIEENLKQKK